MQIYTKNVYLNSLVMFYSLAVLQKDLMVLHELQGVFEVDALVSSHPLSSREDEISTPVHINELFDTITYSKVLQLLH